MAEQGTLVAPVKTGEELDVTVTEMASKGDGVVKVKGFVIFVPGSKIGDSLKIRIMDVKPRFAVGHKIEPKPADADSDSSAAAASGDEAKTCD